MIQVICIDDNRVCSDKEYFINGYIYSQNNEYQPLFTDIEYTNKKYNKLVSFFQKYIHTVEEPLEMVKNGCNINPIDNNDIITKPEVNEYEAAPIAY